MKQAFFLGAICLTLLLSQNKALAESYGGGSSAASSGMFYFEETFFPVYVKKNDAQSSAGGSTTSTIPTESGLGYDFRTTLGMVAWNEVLFGLSFNLYKIDTSRPRTADYEGLTTTTSKTEIGPTVGWLVGSWRFMMTYLISAEKSFSEKYTDPTTGDVSLDNKYKNTQGSGFQLAISYGLNLGSGLSIGPTLIYKDVSYKKQSLDALSGSTPASSTVSTPVDSELKPMITLVYRF